MTQLPILYSFRRCPYAMGARMAILASGVRVELREVVLRDKPEEMVIASPKATVPVLVLPDGSVIDESFDIMLWAFHQAEADHWLTPPLGSRDAMMTLIEEATDSFKSDLDAYKYAPRGKNVSLSPEATLRRDSGMEFVRKLNSILADRAFLFADRMTLADVLIAPFIRQFANVNADWFAKQEVPFVHTWLASILTSHLFLDSMTKYDQWVPENEGVRFGGTLPLHR